MSEKIIIKHSFSERILNWGKKNGRHGLPWHPRNGENYDAYKIWVSEIMLQQTQLKTVLPYFISFIKAFPSIQHLAKSSIENVLFQWAGLGYYRRAINLHKSAKKICTKEKFEYPKNASEWIKLPGIGSSTASAISSFVNSERVPVLDTNVLRVLSRRYKIGKNLKLVSQQKKVYDQALNLIPEDKKLIPLYSQFIMDLGSIVCKPVNPACDICPVSADCSAYRDNKVDFFPFIYKKSLKFNTINWLVCLNENLILLEKQKLGSLWGGLWTPQRIINEKNLPTNVKLIQTKKFPISNYNLILNIWISEKISIVSSLNSELFNFKDLSLLEVPSVFKIILKNLKKN